MSKRIPWNEHEQAVLLQALVDVCNHKIERKQAVSKVSKKLRNYAIARKIAIDDKFRNENGISLQMSCLEYAYNSAGNSRSAFATASSRLIPKKLGAFKYLPDFLSSINIPTTTPGIALSGALGA